MTDYQSALQDFRNARQQAALQTVVSWLTQRPYELLPYDETIRKLKPLGSAERGLQNVPIAAIVGTVGRYNDFTNTFLPLKNSDIERWARMRAAVQNDVILPPVELYQVGAAYFVRDGHHRISLAKQEGATHIEAYVTEVRTLVSLEADITPAELIIKAEYADFLECTRLIEAYPNAQLSLTEPGQYGLLLQTIEAHQRWLTVNCKRNVDFFEAVCHWYAETYLPLVALVQERGLLHDFPGRTETDLYLWMAQYRDELEKTLGWRISPLSAAKEWAERRSKEPQDGSARKGDQAFRALLVPFQDSPGGWAALEQALVIASHERAKVNGLHIIRATKPSAATQQLQARFNQRVQEAGKIGTLAVESGPAAQKICERALLTDLVILPVAHPPEEKVLARLSSGLRTILHNSARPILTVKNEVSQFRHGFLAYDGGSQADEAIFLAVYLAERWGCKLTLATAIHAKLPADVPQRAHAYCTTHQIQAEFVEIRGTSEQNSRERLQQACHEQGCDFILMGAYGISLAKEFRLGSLVDFFLREMSCPIFICR